MTSLVKTVLETGKRLGLKPAAGSAIVFGVKDGYLVEAARGGDDNNAIVEIVRYGDPARDGAVREAIQRSPGLAAAGVHAKKIQVADGLAMYTHARPMFRSLDAARIAGEVDALLAAVKTGSPPPAAACRLCGGTSASEPILVNGVIDRVCPACVERLQHEAKVATQRYEELPTNVPLAVLAAAVLAVVAAAVWAGVAIATNRMFWVIAIAGGALIGWGTTKAAGRGGLIPQVLGGGFTVASVLLGEVLLAAYRVQQYAKARGGSVHWDIFISKIPAILWDLGGDTLFALGGGLIGAFYAVRTAGKPRLEVKVEKG